MNKAKHRYDRIAVYYDLLEAPMELLFSKWRRAFLSKTSGRTLEVGIGTGKSIPFYPSDVDLTGIDISSKMIEITGKRLRKHPRPNTHENLLKAGFKPEQIEVKNLWLDIVKLFQVSNSKSTH